MQIEGKHWCPLLATAVVSPDTRFQAALSISMHEPSPSPATFQTMMDGIFKELITEGVVVICLDDILIFTKTLEEHWEVICKFVALLQLHKNSSLNQRNANLRRPQLSTLE